MTGIDLPRLRGDVPATGVRHMNGRIYSPELGRMLSPDPVTQAPENGQNYNRYTYAFNNPLKYSDPSGYKSKKGNAACVGDSCNQSPAYQGEEVVVVAQDLSGMSNSNSATLGNAGLGNAAPPATPGDIADAGGAPIVQSTPVDEDEDELQPGECNGTECRAALNPWVPGDNIFWEDVANGTGWAALLTGGLSVVCIPCTPVTGPVALGLTGVSMGSDFLSGSGIESLEATESTLIENGLNQAMSIHPLLSKVPKAIREKISAAIGLSIGGAGMLEAESFD